MKHIFCILIFVSIYMYCYSKYSDTFLIGAYSQYELRRSGTVSETGYRFDELGNFLKQAGFNATTLSFIQENDATKLNSALVKLDADSVDAILQDTSWSPLANGPIGLEAISFGNYLKMEAEYQLKYDLGLHFENYILPSSEDDSANDQKNYVFAHECGTFDYSPGSYSNQYTWKCTAGQDNSGYALYCPRFRWKPNNIPYQWPIVPAVNPRFFGCDFTILKSGDVHPELENRLYFTVAVDWAVTQSNNAIAEISLQVSDSDIGLYDDYSAVHYYTLNLHSCHPSSYDTTIRDIAYSNSDVPNDLHNFRLFEYYVDFPTNSTTNPSFNDVLHDGFFHSINPRIYWYGNTDLKIDYIILEDKLHRSLRTETNSTYLERLNTRLTQIDNLNTENNIAMFYTNDEPYQGEFDTYRILDSLMIQQDKNIITVCHFPDIEIEKPNGLPSYFHPGLFAKDIIPRNIMIDPYPLKENEFLPIEWNTDIDQGRGIQNRMQSFALDEYYRLAKLIKDNPMYHNTKMFFVPQSFGEKGANGNYWRYLTPPLSMQKCLQLLPLCYGVDGIIDFAITSDPTYNYAYDSSDPTAGYYRYTPLMNNINNFANLQESPGTSYQMLKEANAKIKIYGPIIKQARWVDAEKLLTDGSHESTEIDEFGLDDLRVIHDENTSHTPYPGNEGYVQCGYYKDSSDDPIFMLVNRRAVYKSIGSPGVTPLPVESYFTNAYPQVVSFDFSSDLINQFNGRIGLLDPFNNDLCIMNNGREVKIVLAPGDGSLRQIVSVLPANFNCVADSLNRDRYAIGTVNIHHGSNLKIPANRTLHTYPNTKIYVTNHSIFRIYGNLLAEDSTMIYVESGSTLDLSNAVCQWGKGAGIIADSSSIIMDSSNMFDINHPDSWAGISCSNSSISLINNSLIGAADTALDLTNCSLNMVSSTIDVPDNGVGIRIIGHNTGSWIHITGTSTSKSQIYSTGNGVSRTCTGIDYNESRNQLKISDTDFSNLYLAINYLAADAAEDSIINCVFDACYHGLQITGFPGLKLVDNCTFSNDTYGIETSYYQPEIDNCSFMGGTNEFTSNPWVGCGILLDYVTANLPTSKLKGNINGCQFEDLYFGILNHQSSPRICTSSFVRNTNGIAITSTSFLDCSRSARNTLSNIENNIVCDNLRSNGQPTVLSFLKLNWGHNQFYQPENGYDFKFPSSFGIFPHFPLGCVNADGNYWSDFAITTYPYTNFIYANYMDPVTHLLNYDVNDSIRFENATALQDTCLYSDADQMFRDILADRCDSEASYWGLCVDRSYLCSVLGNLDLYDLIDYYQTQMDATPDSLNDLKLLARDYQAKAYIQLEEYQSAADLIELYLEDPESEVDSLNAVLDLEICYLLSSLSQSKKPLITEYSQYKYPDIPTYQTNHRKHLQQLLELMNKSDNQSAPVSVLSLGHNYPNPFNPSTTIEYSVPMTAKVKLRIYNIRGQLVKELVNQTVEPGRYKAVWEGKNNAGHSVASGVYFYRIEANGKTITKKMLMLK